MKTITKLLSGALLTSTLLMGCSVTGSFHNTQTTSVTDADGTVTETTTVDGKTTTKTYKTFTKDTSFDNETGITFEELEMKASDADEDEYEDVLEDEELESGYRYHYEEFTFKEDVTSVDFKVEDEDGEEIYFEGVDVSNIKDLETVNFVFEADGNTLTVSVQ